VPYCATLVRILRRPTGTADGISLGRFEIGLIYDVGNTVANLLLAEGWAAPYECAPTSAPVLPGDEIAPPRKGKVVAPSGKARAEERQRRRV
jgi:hypothetical protein